MQTSSSKPVTASASPLLEEAAMAIHRSAIAQRSKKTSPRVMSRRLPRPNGMAQADRAFQPPDLLSTGDQNLQLLIGGTLPWPYNKRARILPDPVGAPT